MFAIRYNYFLSPAAQRGAIFWQYCSICSLLCLGWKEQQLKYIPQLLPSKYSTTVVGCTGLPMAQGTVENVRVVCALTFFILDIFLE